MIARSTPLAMRPEGLGGRVFGALMEAINAPAYRFALDLLEIEPESDVLEIGFGTGRMIELMLARTSGLVVGVDPARTMVDVANARTTVRRADARVRLSLGSDGDLDFPPASFNRVVALHSFQFWPDPSTTVRHLRSLLRPEGRFTLVLRGHSRGGADWLPNPLSKAADEPEAARRLLADQGFDARLFRRARMVGVVGDLR
ncbi:MAG: class I SAM-dependent methyltransferase [Caulobacteraceae bacterium]